ncbi:hypothetical protein FB645_001460 [Coemansia sp. IMI 203386]|nr:hypothetical protein FB645_001460 [Coemansia sp. IMI 203386]
MKLRDSSFAFQDAAVVAFPDTTRLAGYRAALGLWSSLVASNSHPITTTVATFDSEPEIVAESQQLAGADTQDAQTGVNVVFASTEAEPRLTFCFVNGLPEQKRVAEFADRLVGLLEERGVKRLVVAAAANVSGVRDDDQLWVHMSQRSLGGQLAQSLAGIQRLPAGGVDTNDVFLSALSNLADVSGIDDVGVLVHGDKRPSGSTNRQRSTFGGDHADDSDGVVVGALTRALATACGGATDVAVASALETEATRVCLDIESAAKGLSAFN